MSSDTSNWWSNPLADGPELSGEWQAMQQHAAGVVVLALLPNFHCATQLLIPPQSSISTCSIPLLSHAGPLSDETAAAAAQEALGDATNRDSLARKAQKC